MANFTAISWENADTFHRSDAHYQGHTAWAMASPTTGSAVIAAGQLLGRVTDSAALFNEVFAIWTQFEDAYGGSDASQVVTAMSEVARELEAFQSATKMFYDGVVEYDAAVQKHDGKKSDYDTWATDWTDRYSQFLVDQDRPLDEFMTKYRVPKLELHSRLEAERAENEPTAQNIQLDIATARQTLADTLNAIDFDDLAELRFTIHSAGLDRVDSTEEMEFMLLNNHLFGDQLSAADAKRVAAEIDIESLPYSYIDENGVKWIRTSSGELVVVGSAMDPNLQLRTLEVLANDPWTKDIKVDPWGRPSTSDKVRNEGLLTLSEVFFDASNKVFMQPVSGAGIVMGTAGGTAIAAFSVVSWGHAGDQHAAVMSSSHFLMTEDQIHEVRQWAVNREMTITGVTTAAGVALMFIPGVGALGTVAAFGLDFAVGSSISLAMDAAWDNAQTESEMMNEVEMRGLPDAYDPEEHARLIEERNRRFGTTAGGGGRPMMRSAQ